jgi:hypothetical protein
MQGNRDHGVDAPPELFVPADGLKGETGQLFSKDGKPAVLIEQDQVLQSPVIPAAGAMNAERRPLIDARPAEMGFSSALIKPPATGANGGLVRPDLPPAIRADDALPRLIEEPAADSAE